MRARNVIALVVGSVMAVVGIGLLLAGASFGVAAAVERDDDGYFDVMLDRIETDAAVLVSDDVNLGTDGDAPMLLDLLDTDIRLRVSDADTRREVFVGIARRADIEDFLSGVARTDVIGVDDGALELRSRAGEDMATPPTEAAFWTVSASGRGVQEIEWEAQNGRWGAVVMNADASPGITVDVEAGVRSGLVVPLAIVLGVGGLLILVGAVIVILIGARPRGDDHDEPEPRRSDLVSAPTPTPEQMDDHGAPLPPPAGPPVPAAAASPVHYSAALDENLSRWMWLVKWFLAIPHFIVLAFLWVGFVVLTVVAWFAIVATRRYPQSIFDVNVGILRWTWRVTHYASSGGLGTDRYPPFTLAARPDDAVQLDIDHPAELSRWLPFVKVLFAIPHLVIVGLLSGPTVRWLGDDDVVPFMGVGGGLLGVLVLVAGVVLLVRGAYPTALYDLVAGLNRWILRVVAYVGLMTDAYPPFRLDQGPTDPAPFGPSRP